MPIYMYVPCAPAYSSAFYTTTSCVTPKFYKFVYTTLATAEATVCNYFYILSTGFGATLNFMKITYM